MKSLILSVLCIVAYGFEMVSAQAISRDSVVNIALSHINRYNQNEVRVIPLTPEDLDCRFSIEDIVTQKRFAGESSGIYVFSQLGYDVPLWIMLNDSTGCKVYLADDMNSEMLGQLLLFFRRNNYSPEKSLQYIEKIYMIIYIMSNIGERLLEAPILPELD